MTLNLRFPGQYYDAESGLHQNFFRDYDPSTGRYVESDPIGLGGGTNAFVYASGNPLANTDFFGLRDVIVAVWDREWHTGSVGHVFVGELDGTTISSQFPDPRGRMWGRNTTLSWQATLEAEGRSPDAVYKVSIARDDDLNYWSEKMRGRKDWTWKPSTNPNSTNCTHAAYEELSGAGLHLVRPELDPMTPNDFHDSMNALIDTGDGHVQHIDAVPFK